MIHELSRTYIFSDNTRYTVGNVRKVLVSKSGGHRLTTIKGGMVYIPYKWNAIEIQSNHGWEI